MKVTLERTFPLPAAADTGWLMLQDIEAVAGCMPGARITERVSEKLYKGTVAVKFGPASMSFRGDVEVVSLDPASRTLHLLGKGTDSTGGSGATMDLTARVEAVDAVSSKLVGLSEVSMSGKAAAFGGRMIDSVADQLLKQFATNFSARVKAKQPEQSADASKPVEPAAMASRVAAPPAASAPQPQPLNGWALIWAAITGWLRGLFAGKKT